MTIMDMLKNLAANNAGQVGQTVSQIPQTQQDIRQIAQATQYAQSPGFQAKLQTAETAIEQYAKIQLLLQAISTVAVAGIFLIEFSKFRKGK